MSTDTADETISSLEIARSAGRTHLAITESIDRELGHSAGDRVYCNAYDRLVGARVEYRIKSKPLLQFLCRKYVERESVGEKWDGEIGSPEIDSKSEMGGDMDFPACFPKSEENPKSFFVSSGQSLNQKAGFVYILTNEHMPGLVKVGMTTRAPSLRADEISSATGVPAPFVVAKYFEFSDAMRREREFHDKHEDLRLSGREFFKMSLEEAIESLMSGEKPLSAGGSI